MQLFITPGAIPVTDGKNAQISGVTTLRPGVASFESVLRTLAGHEDSTRLLIPEQPGDSADDTEIDPQDASENQEDDPSYVGEIPETDSHGDCPELRQEDAAEGDISIPLGPVLPSIPRHVSQLSDQAQTGVGNFAGKMGPAAAGAAIHTPPLSQSSVVTSPVISAPRNARPAETTMMPPVGGNPSQNVVISSEGGLPFSGFEGVDQSDPRSDQIAARRLPQTPFNVPETLPTRAAPALSARTGHAPIPVIAENQFTPHLENPGEVQFVPVTRGSPPEATTAAVPDETRALARDQSVQFQDRSAKGATPEPQAVIPEKTQPKSAPMSEGQTNSPSPNPQATPLVPTASLMTESPAQEDRLTPEGPSVSDGVTSQVSAPPSRTNAPPPIAKQVLHQLADTPLQQGDKVEITLSPDELGRVRLTARQTDQGVVLLVQAERPETLDLMRRHMPDLMQDLQNMGFGDVSYSGGRTPNRDQGQAEASSPTPEPIAPPKPQTYVSGTGLDLRL